MKVTLRFKPEGKVKPAVSITTTWAQDGDIFVGVSGYNGTMSISGLKRGDIEKLITELEKMLDEAIDVIPTMN